MSEAANLDLASIYDAYYAKVKACVAKLIGREEAEDITHEVFLKVGRSLESLTDRSKLTSWIYTIALNAVRDNLRARSSRPDARAESLDATPEDDGVAGALSRIPDLASRTPEELVMRREMVACYLDYVKQLPPHYLDVYVLSEFDELPNEEIARRLSLSPGAVKIRLHRARARLNGELRRNCECYCNERGELMGAPKRR